MLHIFNGDATEAIFKQTRLPGETLSWREALITGPCPADLPEDDWIKIRMEHLVEAYGANPEECKNDLSEQMNRLKKASGYDEVVLWFEFDLFCQLNLIHVLSILSQQKELPSKLSLVCIDKFPDVEPFHGLGQLFPQQLSSLYDKRKPVTREMLALGHEAWQAFTSPNPEAVEKFLQKDTSALPFLKKAFAAHLSQFPSTKNGLGWVQNEIMDLMAGGIDEFKPLFPLLQELNPAYGLGDLQLWYFIRELGNSGDPLIEIFNLDTTEHPAISRSFLHAYFRLTTIGKAVLVGNRDMLNINHVDYWLGGVHINHDNPIWRWDTKEKKLYRDD